MNWNRIYFFYFLVSLCVLAVVTSNSHAQVTYLDPENVCGSVSQVTRNNQLGNYEACLTDNVNTLLYMGSCGNPVNDAQSIEASDICELFVQNLPTTQVNGFTGAGFSPFNSAMIIIFGVVAVVGLSKSGAL